MPSNRETLLIVAHDDHNDACHMLKLETDTNSLCVCICFVMGLIDIS